MTSAIVDYAAQHGYSFDEAVYACAICTDDERNGSTYWHDRGPGALLESVRASSQQTDISFASTLASQAKRY